MTYTRELEHARRDVGELHDLMFARPLGDLTVKQIAQAIGLADMTRRALFSAIRAMPPASPTEGPQA